MNPASPSPVSELANKQGRTRTVPSKPKSLLQHRSSHTRATETLQLSDNVSVCWCARTHVDLLVIALESVPIALRKHRPPLSGIN